MEFVPFGQYGIPPTAGNAAKCRMLYNLLEFVYKKGIEAFNLLNFLPSYLLNFFLFPLATPLLDCIDDPGNFPVVVYFD